MTGTSIILTIVFIVLSFQTEQLSTHTVPGERAKSPPHTHTLLLDIVRQYK